MNRQTRMLFLVVSAIVLVGGFVVARNTADDATRRQPGAPGRAETTPSAATSPGQTTSPSSAEPTPATPPPPRVETIRIKDRRPAGEVRTITYDSGETVRLRFRSNVAEEVHIHGYDKYVDVPAGGSATARFKANAEGIFEIEAHSTGELLARLKVQP